MQKNTAPLPNWEIVLSSAARLQQILPEKVRFDSVLAELEAVAGWKTARVQRPVQILGSLDGIETGVRQLIRDKPLETMVVDKMGAKITIPTEAEILRIKGVLILKRNATRDYLDFVALADHMGHECVASAMQNFDQIYHQDNMESPLQQLQVQLANAEPYDLEETELSEYKSLAARWHDWQTVKDDCALLSIVIFDGVCEMDASEENEPDPTPNA